ncbi:MAG: hypothetical protein CK547_02360 [Chitinophagaceae bacterium]|nr:MAG: hypothetical protein CK547_02360 [Chitinophagaceae bacterium]
MEFKSAKIQLSIYIIWMALLSLCFSMISCDSETSTDRKRSPSYVSPSINYKGQFRKGYVRKSVSTNKNAIRNQARSKYYYETRGKYRRKNKNR